MQKESRREPWVQQQAVYLWRSCQKVVLASIGKLEDTDSMNVGSQGRLQQIRIRCFLFTAGGGEGRPQPTPNSAIKRILEI